MNRVCPGTGVLALLLALVFAPPPAMACECVWGGPFVDVAGKAPLIVLGRILRHVPGPQPQMHVQVLDVWKGGILDGGLSVDGGDGAMCRPPIDDFPPGTTWLLALNGPGSKPGKGLALSFCGAYWLKVMDGQATGTIDGPQDSVQTWPLTTLRAQLAARPFYSRVDGEVTAGQTFRHPFGPGLVAVLAATPDGWSMEVRRDDESADGENLARLTPPLHFLPNPRDVEAWHMLDPGDPCLSGRDPATVPGRHRAFIYSPEVGRSIDGPEARRPPTSEEIERIGRFGHGTLSILDHRLERGADGCPRLTWLRFRLQLFSPASPP